MKTNLMLAVLTSVILTAPPSGRPAQANPVVIGPAAQFILKAMAQTATGLVVAESYDSLKQRLAGPPPVDPVSIGEISVGLHSYTEYYMARIREMKTRHLRSVLPNPVSGRLDFYLSVVTIDTNSNRVVSMGVYQDPFTFNVHDLYDTCGSVNDLTQRNHAITTLLAARHAFTRPTASPPAYFTFDLILGHTGTGAGGVCPATAKPCPDGTVWQSTQLAPYGYKTVPLPPMLYPNIVNYLAIGRVSAHGTTTISI